MVGQELRRRDVMIDEGAKKIDDPGCLITAGGAQIDPLVIEASKGSQCVGGIRLHPDSSGGGSGAQHRADERAELTLAGVATQFTDVRRQVVGMDDFRRNSVLEVVAHIGDAIGPTDDFALRCRRRRKTP